MANKKQQKQPSVKSRKVKKQTKGVASRDAAYVKLLRDPCNGPMVYGPTGGSSQTGYVTRLTKRQLYHTTATDNNGYIAWFPDYHNTGINGQFRATNLFVYNASTSSARPVNTIANPLGSGGASGNSVEDPARAFVATSLVASARTIASCVTANFIGTTVSAAGQMAVATNITPSQLLYGGGGNPLSVEEVFNLAQNVDRIPMDKREIVHAPTDLTAPFRGYDSDVRNTTANPTQDGCCLLCPAATAGPSTVATGASGASGIIIAWSGLSNTTTNDFSLTFTKVIEWVPDPFSGIGSPAYAERPTSSYDQVVHYINSMYPGWQDSAARVGMQMAREYGPAMVNRVLGGAGLGVRRVMA